MDEIAISKFKATGLAVLERVRRTGKPMIVIRRGVAIAEIKPPPHPEPSGRWPGSMQGTIVILDDIVRPPAEPESAWEALKDWGCCSTPTSGSGSQPTSDCGFRRANRP